MIIKVIVITVILVAFIMMALGLKLWFNPSAEFTASSCGIENNSIDKDGACILCIVKDIVDCTEKNRI